MIWHLALARTALLVLVLTLASSLSHAARDVRAIDRGLSLADHSQRLRAIRATGPAAVERLKQVARDERASMPLRWRAITALGEIAGASERRTFEELMRSRHWYVRNAALVAMRQSDTARAAHWSRQMLADPALLVRSAAVQSLADVTGPDVNTSTAALWKELDQAENFRGQQSLFIRPQIVASLGRLESSQATGRFVKLLDDRDPKVVAEAKRALSRMHRDSRARSTQDWKRWWQTASERTQSESSRTR